MCAFVFTFVGLCSCLVCVFNPSLVQSSYCSVVVDRRCSEKGEGALVRKHLFDNIKLPVPYSAKRLKILEKGPTCAQQMLQRGRWGLSCSTRGREEESGRVSVFSSCLQGYTSARECVCVSKVFPLEVSGRCLQLLLVLWKCRQASAGQDWSLNGHMQPILIRVCPSVTVMIKMSIYSETESIDLVVLLLLLRSESFVVLFSNKLFLQGL